MNKLNLDIWGRKFILEVVYQLFNDNEATKEQQEAVSEFEDKGIDEETLERVKAYVLKHDGSDNGIDHVDNIFKYVAPKSVFIPKSKDRVVAILCNYKFDAEHGIAIVFKNEKVAEIGPQDIIL